MRMIMRKVKWRRTDDDVENEEDHDVEEVIPSLTNRACKPVGTGIHKIWIP